MKKHKKLQAFTLTELLVSIGVAVILVTLLFAAVQTVSAKSKQAACVANLRNIGVAAHLYAANNNNQWPYFLYNMDPPQPNSTLDKGGANSTNAICQDAWNGLGKLYRDKYLTASNAFFCPADTASPESKNKNKHKWTSETGEGWIGVSYAQRGYKQFNYAYLVTDGRNPVRTGDITQKAMVACWFLRRSNVENDQISYHRACPRSAEQGVERVEG